MDEHISIIHRENSLTTDMPQTSQLGINLKTHSVEKLNKCSQCDYESFQAGHLKIRLKKNIVE